LDRTADGAFSKTSWAVDGWPEVVFGNPSSKDSSIHQREESLDRTGYNTFSKNSWAIDCQAMTSYSKGSLQQLAIDNTCVIDNLDVIHSNKCRNCPSPMSKPVLTSNITSFKPLR